MRRPPARRPPDGFLLSVTLLRDRVSSFDEYPFSIPAIRALDSLRFNPQITFYHLSPEGIIAMPYEETEHFQVTQGFLANRKDYLRHLLSDESR